MHNIDVHLNKLAILKKNRNFFFLFQFFMCYSYVTFSIVGFEFMILFGITLYFAIFNELGSEKKKKKTLENFFLDFQRKCFFCLLETDWIVTASYKVVDLSIKCCSKSTTVKLVVEGHGAIYLFFFQKKNLKIISRIYFEIQNIYIWKII